MLSKNATYTILWTFRWQTNWSACRISALRWIGREHRIGHRIMRFKNAPAFWRTNLLINNQDWTLKGFETYIDSSRYLSPRHSERSSLSSSFRSCRSPDLVVARISLLLVDSLRRQLCWSNWSSNHNRTSRRCSSLTLVVWWAPPFAASPLPPFLSLLHMWTSPFPLPPFLPFRCFSLIFVFVFFCEINRCIAVGKIFCFNFFCIAVGKWMTVAVDNFFCFNSSLIQDRNK